MTERLSRLEENLLSNLAALRAHRLGLDEVMERRKERAQQVLKELQRPSSDYEALGPLALAAVDTAPPNAAKNMRERLLALEENAEQNQDVLGGHRKVLNEVQAVNQGHLQDISAGGKLPGHESASACQPGLSPDEHLRFIEENSRWMGPGLQRAAVAKAKNDEERAARHQQASEAPAVAPVSRLWARPGSASRTVATENNDDVSAGTPVQRPTSAATTRGSQRRPPSASSAASQQQRPGSALDMRAQVRPSSRLSSGRSSRPLSADSLTTRFRAMENNLQRNQQTMQSHRQIMDQMARNRQEQAENLAAKISLMLQKVC